MSLYIAALKKVSITAAAAEVSMPQEASQSVAEGKKTEKTDSAGGFCAFF